jgi:prepilin-type N-terminal cleavage/methylation domain-containing protein
MMPSPGFSTAETARTPGLSFRRGFTLVEVITGIVLVAALSAVVIPTVMQRTRAARAEAIVSEFMNLRTGLLMFYNDVGRFPKTLEYLNAIPGSPVDVCNTTLQTINTARFRGPYMTRPIYHLTSGGIDSYPLATGDSVRTDLAKTTFNGIDVVQISIFGPERDIVELVDQKVDGAVDASNGEISWSGGGPILAQYTIRLNIPIRNPGC